MPFGHNIPEGLVVKDEYFTVWVEVFGRHGGLVGFPLLLLLRLEMHLRSGGNDGSGRLGQRGQRCRLCVLGDVRGEEVVGAGFAVGFQKLSVAIEVHLRVAIDTVRSTEV